MTLAAGTSVAGYGAPVSAASSAAAAHPFSASLIAGIVLAGVGVILIVTFVILVAIVYK